MQLILDDGTNSIDFYGDSQIGLISCEGVGIDGSPVTVPNGTEDGSNYISAHVPERTITITAHFKIPSEAAKHRLYSICRTRRSVRLTYRSDCRCCYIDGYIDSCDAPPNAKPFGAIISILCPNPYFTAETATSVGIMDITPCFKFPLALPAARSYKLAELSNSRIGVLTNGGEVDCGVKFTLTARGAVSTPKLQDTGTYKWIAVRLDLLAGDKLIIDTRQGNRSIVLHRGGEVTDCINCLVWGSDFLQLAPGVNRIAVSADSGAGNIMVKCEFNALYGGI